MKAGVAVFATRHRVGLATLCAALLALALAVDQSSHDLYVADLGNGRE